MVSATKLQDFLTPSQAARRLEVSTQMVNRWMAVGRLPALTTPLGRLLDPADVGRLAEERKRQRAEKAGQHDDGDDR